jgi:hypothetical protein
LPEQGSKEKFFADSLYKYNSDFPYEAVCNQPYEEVVYNSQPEVSSKNVETKETVHSGEAEKKTAENSVSVPYTLLTGAAVVLAIVTFIVLRKKNIKK